MFEAGYEPSWFEDRNGQRCVKEFHIGQTSNMKELDVFKINDDDDEVVIVFVFIHYSFLVGYFN